MSGQFRGAPASRPAWHGKPVTAEQAAEALERAVEFKWDAHRAHVAVRTQAIAALTEQGMSVREVARALGVSKSLVAKQLKDTYFEPSDELRAASEAGGFAVRTRELVTKAWNGLWDPAEDPEFGTAARSPRPQHMNQDYDGNLPTNFGGTNGPIVDESTN